MNFGPDLNGFQPTPIIIARKPYISPQNDRIVAGDVYQREIGYLNCFECDIFQVIPTINYDTVQIVSRGSGPHALRYVLDKAQSIPGNGRINNGIPTNIFDDWVTPANSLGSYNQAHFNVPYGNIPFYIHSLGSTVGKIYLNVQLFNLGRRSDRNCIIGAGSTATGGGGTSASISPSDLANNQLHLNIFAGTFGLSNGQTVSQIIDNGGFAGRDALQVNPAKRGLFTVPGAPNGRPGLFTDGTKKYVGSMPGTGPTNANGMTFYANVNPASLAGVQTLFESQDELSPSLFLGANVGWVDALGTHTIAPGIIGNQILIWNFAPPNDGTGICTVYRNGVSIGSSPWQPGAATFDNAYSLLIDLFETSGFIGTFNEIIFFNVSHNSTIMAGVYQFISDYWTQ